MALLLSQNLRQAEASPLKHLLISEIPPNHNWTCVWAMNGIVLLVVPTSKMSTAKLVQLAGVSP